MDQIADVLTRIRNAALARKHEVTVSFSKMKEAILDILKNEGYLESVEIIKKDERKFIKVVISSQKTPTHMKQISKAGRRIYAKNKEIPAPLRGMGLVIVSTSNGVITGREARKSGLGGELICEIW